MTERRPHHYLIAGAGGMLGTALQRVLTERKIPFEAPAEADFDITDPDAVRAVVDVFAGEGGTLINAAAFTNVDAAEDEPELVYRVNEYGAGLLAKAAHDGGLGFVHVSTDFVFDGAKDGAYTEDDEPDPLSVYGASKLAGEIAVERAYPGALTVRTAWVYGPAGANFPNKVLELSREREVLRIVDDQVGSPTFTHDLTSGILALCEADASGLYHLAGSGYCSRYELALETLRLAGRDTIVEPVSSSEFPMKAERPLNSVLDCRKAASIGVEMPAWGNGLARYVRIVLAAR